MTEERIRLDWRHWLILIVFAGLTFFVFTRFTDIKDLVSVFTTAKWTWALVALGLHVLYFVMYAHLYHLSYHVVDVESSTLGLIPVMFSSLFVNTVVPAGGAAGAALFIADATRRRQSAAAATVGILLVVLADLGTLIPFVLYGLIFLRLRHDLRVYDAAISAMFLAYLVLLVLAFGITRWRPGLLRRVLSWVRRAANWAGGLVKHPDLVAEAWPDRTTAEFKQAADAIVAHPARLTAALGWAFLLHIVNLAGLYCLFLAFEQSIQLGALVAGFSLGIVFFVVSVVPQGVAVVEGIMALVFKSTGVPASQTAAIVLAFRGLNYYLPLVFGLFLVQYLNRAHHGIKVEERPALEADPEEDESG